MSSLRRKESGEEMSLISLFCWFKERESHSSVGSKRGEGGRALSL